MQEVRYTNKLTPLTWVVLLLAASSAWYVYHLAYSMIILYPPTKTTLIKLVFSLAALAYCIIEFTSWCQRRNAVAFKLGYEGVWTEDTGWLIWQIIDFKVDKWRDVISIAYDSAGVTNLMKWQISELNISSNMLIVIKNELSANR